jgi:hypothetical protein
MKPYLSDKEIWVDCCSKYDVMTTYWNLSRTSRQRGRVLPLSSTVPLLGTGHLFTDLQARLASCALFPLHSDLRSSLFLAVRNLLKLL